MNTKRDFSILSTPNNSIETTLLVGVGLTSVGVWFGLSTSQENTKKPSTKSKKKLSSFLSNIKAPYIF